MASSSAIPPMNLVLQPVLHVEARVKTNSDGLIIRTDLVG